MSDIPIKPPASADRIVRGGQQHAKQAADHPLLQALERLGYVVRGLLYGIMGLLALGVALGVGGAATDQKGSLIVLAGNPFGKPLLWMVAIGLAAYSLWGFIRAIFDPLHRGSDPSGLAERLGFAWSGLMYASLVIFTLQFLAGGAGGQGDTTQTMTARMLAHPFGPALTVLAGLVAVAAGIGQFIEAKRAGFLKDLKRHEMSRNELKAAEWLGRLGMFSRGVVFSLVGWFLIQAGLHRNPGESHGFGGAFVFLLQQPYGHALVGVVALGFVALGLHSFANARWMRLSGGWS